MNLSFLAQNHSRVTRLKQFVYRCQMYDTTESWLPNMIQSLDIEFALSIFLHSLGIRKIIQDDDIYKICILLPDKHTRLISAS